MKIQLALIAKLLIESLIPQSIPHNSALFNQFVISIFNQYYPKKLLEIFDRDMCNFDLSFIIIFNLHNFNFIFIFHIAESELLFFPS